MSYVGVLEMNVSAEEAYEKIGRIMLSINSIIISKNPEHLELQATNTPSWTYGFNLNCKVEAVSEVTSRLTVNTTRCGTTLIDMKSKRYTNRLLTVISAYVEPSNRSGAFFMDARFKKSFLYVSGLRPRFRIITLIGIVVLTLLKIAAINR